MAFWAACKTVFASCAEDAPAHKKYNAHAIHNCFAIAPPVSQSDGLQIPSLQAIIRQAACEVEAQGYMQLTLIYQQPKIEFPRKLTLDVLSIATRKIRCPTALISIAVLRSCRQG
jgi:hypothetical protein